jgi:hypothetical protein
MLNHYDGPRVTASTTRQNYDGPTPRVPPTPRPAPLPAKADGLAIASLVLSLTIPVIGSLLAIVFGHLSHRDAEREGRMNSGVATAGLIIGYLGLAAVAIVFIVIAASLHQPDPTQVWINCLNNQISNPSLVCNQP